MDPALLVTAYAVLGVVLVWTSVIDIRTREVPDWLNAALLLVGFSFGLVADSAGVPLGGVLLPALVLVLFTAAFLFDGFVFFPRVASAMERTPWFVQLLVSLGLGAAALAVSHALTAAAPAAARALGGAGLGYLVGVVLYWARQWGGGDAKLLAGVGAVLGFDTAYIGSAFAGALFPAPSFALFLALLLVCGALYGALWLAVLAVMRRREFVPAFRKALADAKTLRLITWCVTALVLVLALYAGAQLHVSFGAYLVLVAALVFGGFYLVIAVRAAERSLMTVSRTPKQLVVGDWVLGPVAVGKRVLVPKSSAGVSEREIASLRALAPSRRVLVRQGVPFVPSFLFAFLVLAFLRWVVFA